MMYRKEEFLNKIICGNVLTELKDFPDNCIDTIITSPPYWGLRDYGEPSRVVWDGDPRCRHSWTKKYYCRKCDAWLGQLGQEPDLELYYAHLLQITLELKRVLKPTGVIFWNHGDKYLKKSLMMQNYRLVQQMVDEQHFYLRNIIIWHKKCYLPGSVKSRFDNAYDSVFMLVKNVEPQYYYNEKTLMMPDRQPAGDRKGQDWDMKMVGQAFNVRVQRCKTVGVKVISADYKATDEELRDCDKMVLRRMSLWHPIDYWFDLHSVRIPHCKEAVEKVQTLKAEGQVYAGKNPGDVWELATQAFPGVHFSTFPERLVDPMIKSSCPPFICRKCGKARVRIEQVKYHLLGSERRHSKYITEEEEVMRSRIKVGPPGMRFGRALATHYSKGWTDCFCNAGWIPGVVLDPFMGSGTTGLVAKKLGRFYVGIEINPFYARMARKRIESYVCRISKGEKMKAA